MTRLQAQLVMASIVMACIVMAYVVLAYIVRTRPQADEGYAASAVPSRTIEGTTAVGYRYHQLYTAITISRHIYILTASVGIQDVITMQAIRI